MPLPENSRALYDSGVVCGTFKIGLSLRFMVAIFEVCRRQWFPIGEGVFLCNLQTPNDDIHTDSVSFQLPIKYQTAFVSRVYAFTGCTLTLVNTPTLTGNVFCDWNSVSLSFLSPVAYVVLPKLFVTISTIVAYFLFSSAGVFGGCICNFYCPFIQFLFRLRYKEHLFSSIVCRKFGVQWWSIFHNYFRE